MTTGLLGVPPSLNRIAAVPGLRLGVPSIQHFTTFDRPFDLFPRSTIPSFPIASLMLPCDAEIISSDEAAAAANVVDLEDVGLWGSVSEVDFARQIESERQRFKNANVLVAKLRPYLGKAFFNADPNRVGSLEWVPLCIDEARYRPRLVARFLQTTAFRSVARVFMSGKEHPRIDPQVLSMLRLPALTVEAQDALLACLDGHIGRVRNLEAHLSRCTQAVDTVFGDEFGLQPVSLLKAKQQRRVCVGLRDMSLSKGLRFGWRHNSPAFQHALGEMQSLTASRVRNALARPIVLGATISPNDYDPRGRSAYISMATIKTWAFEAEKAARVSDDFAERMYKKTALAGDIIMARAGEGTIGKVALLPPEANGIFSDFTMRIRLDRNVCHPTFAYALMMSCYFQELITGEKMGLGNNTNVYPDQISELPFLLPDMTLQCSIARKVEQRLTEFSEARAEIGRLHMELDKMIAAAVCGN